MSDKYHRLVTFLVDICPRALRELFITKAKSDSRTGAAYTTLDAYLKARKSDVDRLLTKNKLRIDQYALVYPTAGSVETDTWDVTLLAILLSELFRKQLRPSEVSCIHGIRDTRNKLQHIANCKSLDDQDFNNHWSVLDHSVKALAKCAGGGSLKSFCVDISEAMSGNMPNLGDVLQTWYLELNVGLKQQVMSLEDKIERLQGNGDELYDKMDELRDQNNQLQQTVDQLQGNNVKLQYKVDQIQEENAGLQEKIKQLQNSSDTLQRTANLLQEQNNDFKEQVGKLQDNDLILRDKVNQLQNHNNKLEYNVDQLQNKVEQQHNELIVLKTQGKQTNKILNKASVKRKRRSGAAEKRIKIIDHKVERMKETLARSLKKMRKADDTLDSDDVELIKEQLQDNHRVIVTGHDDALTYKYALAAVDDLDYQPDLCLEISNPADWRRICSDDARLVVFKDPFGRQTFDMRRTSIMVDEFDNMLEITADEDDDVIDIIIVTNQNLLDETMKKHEHEMLAAACTVYVEKEESTKDFDMWSEISEGGSSSMSNWEQDLPSFTFKLESLVSAEVAESSRPNDDNDKTHIEEVVNAYRSSFENTHNVPKLEKINDFPTQVKHTYDVAEYYIQMLVGMAKKIKSFRNLTVSDQVSLLKGGCMEIFCLHSAFTAIEQITDSLGSKRKNAVLDMLSGITPRFERVDAEGDGLYEKFCDITNSCKLLVTDDTILVLLIVLALFSSDRTNVEDRISIDQIQEEYALLLQRYLELKFPNPLNRNIFPKLLMVLADMRIFGQKCAGVRLYRNEEVENETFLSSLS